MKTSIEWALEKARDQLKICGLVYRNYAIRQQWADDKKLGLDEFIQRRESEARQLKTVIADFEQMLKTIDAGGN